MQGVAVDAQPGGGLDLDAIAGLEDLLDQLALDPADDPIVQVVGVGPAALMPWRTSSEQSTV